MGFCWLRKLAWHAKERGLSIRRKGSMNVLVLRLSQKVYLWLCGDLVTANHGSSERRLNCTDKGRDWEGEGNLRRGQDR